MKVCIWILSIRMSLLLMMLIAVPGIVPVRCITVPVRCITVLIPVLRIIVLPVRCIIVRHLANMTIANR